MYNFSITTGFIFFANLFFNKIKLNCISCVNCFGFFSSQSYFELKNTENDEGKYPESDIENQYNQVDELVINISPSPTLKKVKTRDYNSYYQKEKLLSYSHTFNNLSKLVPPNSPSQAILNELIKNKNNNIMACCNPLCRSKIDVPIHFGFDGYYCTISCRNFVASNMYTYWNQL